MKMSVYILIVLTAVLWIAYAYVPNKGNPTMNGYNLTDYGTSVLNLDDPNALAAYSKATFGAGCFWGTEHVFRQLNGVVATAVGFMGGRVDSPSYKRVCMGDTNHAEVVRLFYDPNEIPYAKLLDVFFEVHDPTTRNRQGNDIGTQYRSVVFYEDEDQKKAAAVAKGALGKSGKFNRPLVTEIVPAKEFWLAEDYHQRYLEKNPAGYCHIPPRLIQQVVRETNNQENP